jgi:hypothetical protein
MISYVNAFHLTAFVATVAIPLACFMRRMEREQP